jgi:hypothetical protein
MHAAVLFVCLFAFAIRTSARSSSSGSSSNADKVCSSPFFEQQLAKFPQAVRLHSDPDIVSVAGWLSDQECDDLVDLYDSRMADRAPASMFCFSGNGTGHFSERDWQLPPDVFQNQEGHTCSRHARAADVLKGEGVAVSASVLVAKAESGAVDAVGAKLREGFGLDEDNAFHTQVRDPN